MPPGQTHSDAAQDHQCWSSKSPTMGCPSPLCTNARPWHRSCRQPSLLCAREGAHSPPLRLVWAQGLLSAQTSPGGSARCSPRTSSNLPLFDIPGMQQQQNIHQVPVFRVRGIWGAPALIRSLEPGLLMGSSCSHTHRGAIARHYQLHVHRYSKHSPCRE